MFAVEKHNTVLGGQPCLTVAVLQLPRDPLSSPHPDAPEHYAALPTMSLVSLLFLFWYRPLRKPTHDRTVLEAADRTRKQQQQQQQHMAVRVGPTNPSEKTLHGIALLLVTIWHRHALSVLQDYL